MADKPRYRRGRYRTGAGADPEINTDSKSEQPGSTPGAPATAPRSSTEWTPDDNKLFRGLVAKSPVVSTHARRELARVVVEAGRLCRRLDEMINRTADDDGNMTRANKTRIAALDRLKLTDKLKDDEDPL